MADVSPRGPLCAGLVCIWLLMAGCAPAPSVVAPAPRPLSEAEIDALASLLRVEDTRTFDAEVLREAAAAPSAAVRRRAALALGRLRRPAGHALLGELLQDPDTAIRATAAFALGQVGDTAAVTLLRPLLASEARTPPTVAAEAASALGKLQAASAHRALIDVLSGHPVDAARGREPVASALLAVWKFPRGSDLASVVRWTEAADPELRWRATYALVRRPDPAAIPVLRRLTTDPDPRVRALAVRGLAAPLADSAKVGAATVLPEVLAALEDTDYGVRINALRTLGSYPVPAAVQALQDHLRAGEPHEVLAAVESLGRIGAAAVPAAPALRALALDASAPVAHRQAALEALARAHPGETRTLAAAMAGEGAWRLRAASARALAVVDGPRAPLLARLIRDPDGRVAASALQAAVSAAGDSLAPLRSLLLEAAGVDDVMVRAAALAALGRLAEPSVLPVLLDGYGRATRDSLDDAALAALEALGRLQGVSAERALFARFGRPKNHLIRLRALQLFGDAARAAWGDPLPLDPERENGWYREQVRRFADAAQPAPRVEIATDAGVVVLRLFAAEAPMTVQNLLRLARRGYFDGQEWPRVVPNFVIQGGDPRGDTSGGPGYSIRDEINRHRYGAGTLGMALSGPDTGGSQFFVTHSPQPHLDGTYTVFGEVVEGQKVVERVLPGDRIHHVRVLP